MTPRRLRVGTPWGGEARLLPGVRLHGAAVVAAAVVAAAVPAACGGDEEAAPPGPTRVETLVVAATAFEARLMTMGTVDMPDDATLSAEVGGTVAFIVEEGAGVGAGQVVARLDSRAEEAAVTSARAAVLDARAVVAQAEDAYRRQLPLARDTIISELELRRIDAERTQARARLLQAQAQLQEARDRVEQTLLRAPFAGRVERVAVRRGEQVSPGMEVLRLIRPGRADIEAGVPERYAGDIEVGSAATVDLQAYGAGAREGRVTFVGAAVDPGSRTFPVRISLPDPTGVIKSDMVARVHLTYRVIPAAVVLPLDAVQRDDRGESVLVAVAGAGAYVVQRRDIVTGPRSADGIVVEAGLQPGEEVIVVGIDDVADGEAVEITRRHAGVAAFRAATRPAGADGPGP
jgi:membrane fusion protein, multidrug efflux system